jgi:hypothetical protein
MMYRFQIVSVPRADTDKRDEVLWELGRSGWDLIQVLEGSATDATDKSQINMWFKREASSDIGM